MGILRCGIKTENRATIDVVAQSEREGGGKREGKKEKEKRV
jgi:hypothetical protein